MPLPPSNGQRDVVSRFTAKLAQLGHDVSFAEPVTTGPIVTTYRFVPSGGTKMAQLAALTDDLAIALEAEDVLIRRLSGEGAIGISVPNRERRPVLWRNTMSVPERLDPDLELRPPAAVPLNMGVLDWQGYPFRHDLAAMPHLLIVGSTNSGKSTWMLGALASLIFWRKPYGPGAVQLALSDTKCVEFHQFDGAPHLWCDIATSPEATWQMMDRLLDEMELRLLYLRHARVRNILEYNAAAPSRRVAGAMSYIDVVIDELADVLGNKAAAQRLSSVVQKSRACGVHVIAGTQRPSVNVVAGSIKANFPARLTFRLPSDTDTRTAIGASGAEHLLTPGDMLYSSPSQSGLRRLHAGYASIEDVTECVKLSKMQHEMQYA